MTNKTILPIQKFILYVFVLIANLGVTNFGWAQTVGELVIPDELRVVEGLYPLKNSKGNGYDILIQEVGKSPLKEFRKELKDSYGINAKKKGSSLVALDQMVNTLSDKKFDLYVYMVKDQEGKHLRLWMSIDGDNYISSSSHNAESYKLSTLLKDFVREYYSNYLQDQIDDQTKAVNKMSRTVDKDQKSLARLKSDKEKLESKLLKTESKQKKLEAKLTSIQSEIATNAKDMKNMKDEIDNYEVKIKSENINVEDKSSDLNRTNEELEIMKKGMEKLVNLK